MSDRPILFSAPMVRALLDGRKTQTRRLVKDAPSEPGWICYEAKDQRKWIGPNGYPSMPCVLRFAKGDRLWVRETWAEVGSFDPGLVVTRADYPACVPKGFENIPTDDAIKWKPGIHMKRECSRLTLTVTEVRVQQLLDISEDDAKAEGFASGQLDDGFEPRDIGGGYTIESPGTYASAGGMFQLTWSKLHPEWDGYSNPWVTATTFTVERRNIDAE